MRSDTMIITGTAKVWRLRAGDKVIDICNLNYNPIGATPGTGTASRWIQRVVKATE
jgi:type IV secretion system protein VirB9